MSIIISRSALLQTNGEKENHVCVVWLNYLQHVIGEIYLWTALPILPSLPSYCQSYLRSWVVYSQKFQIKWHMSGQTFFSGVPFGHTTTMPSKESYMAKGKHHPFHLCYMDLGLCVGCGCMSKCWVLSKSKKLFIWSHVQVSYQCLCLSVGCWYFVT